MLSSESTKTPMTDEEATPLHWLILECLTEILHCDIELKS